MSAYLDELILLSHYAGRRADYVQGGGGNSSVKPEQGKMSIKASGTELGDMTPERGHVLVEREKIVEGIHAGHDDAGFNALIMSAVSPESPLQGRPSIEAGFHAVLGRCVLHTHSVYANVLNCSEEGRELIAGLFPEALLVGYGEPGLGITQAVALAAGDASVSGLAFLQSHGVIVWGEAAQSVIDLHEYVNSRIRGELGLREMSEAGQGADGTRGVLFPDQAVYLSPGAGTQSVAARQTLTAASYIESSIDLCGLTPRYLSTDQMAVLRAMESEQYRLKQAAAQCS